MSYRKSFFTSLAVIAMLALCLSNFFKRSLFERPISPKQSFTEQATRIPGRPIGESARNPNPEVVTDTVSSQQETLPTHDSEIFPSEGLPPQLKRIHEIRTKGLPSEAERQEFAERLRDPKTLAECERSLFDFGGAEPLQSRMNRFVAITTLDAMMTAGPNDPVSKHAQALAQSVIERDLKPLGLDENQKHNLAGDKVELLVTLIQYAPGVVDSIEKNAASDTLRRVVAYARKLHKTRIAPINKG